MLKDSQKEYFEIIYYVSINLPLKTIDIFNNY